MAPDVGEEADNLVQLGLQLIRIHLLILHQVIAVCGQELRGCHFVASALSLVGRLQGFIDEHLIGLSRKARRVYVQDLL